MSIEIVNGRVLDPGLNLDGKYDILIQDGLIVEVAPQGEGLQDKVVLSFVVVGELGASAPVGDGQGRVAASRAGIEILLEIVDHALHRVPIGPKEAVVVRHGMDDLENALFADMC